MSIRRSLLVAALGLSMTCGATPSVFGLGSCDPVEGLTAVDPDCFQYPIELSWSLSGDPTWTIEVERDGVLIATLPGTAQGHVDLSVPDGDHSYGVRVLCGAGASAQETVDVTARSSGPPANVVFRLEAPDSGTDSATALEEQLTLLGLDWVERTSLVDMECIAPYTTLWVLCGTFPHQTPLDPAAGEMLYAHALAGGSVYFESSDAWVFDVPTAFAQVDGVDGMAVAAGMPLLTSLSGLDSGVGLDFSGLTAIDYASEQPGGDFVNWLAPATSDALGSATGSAWQEGTGVYVTGIAYTASNGARIVSQSWELGGYEGDRGVVVEQLVEYLGADAPPAPRFIRGDVDENGAVELADVNLIASGLFDLAAPVPMCRLAGDANGDGRWDVSDAIYLAHFLFLGSAPPPAPYPSCGTGASFFGCLDSDACP